MVVIGGGISGLAAAAELSQMAGVRVTVLEASDHLGGKLAQTEVGGVRIDTGAESLLNTRPEAVALAREAGLADKIVHPATAKAWLWSGGNMHPMPAGLVMGAPSDIASVVRGGVLSPLGTARLLLGNVLHRRPLDSHANVSIGDYIASRVGRDVVDRLVDPLLAGVYAGDPYALDLRAVAPSLAKAAAQQPTLVAAARAARRTPTVPVFAGVDGGIGSLPIALARTLESRGVWIRRGTQANALTRAGDGRWSVASIRTPDGAAEPPIECDAVVLAIPAFASSSLLRPLAPEASRELDEIPYASVAVVSFAYPAAQKVHLPEGSGFLVPSVDRRFIKASTFSSIKWSWTGRDSRVDDADGLLVLRASVGRWKDTTSLQRTDAEIVAGAHADLVAAIGLTSTAIDTHVQRWNDSLPQYLVGHQERVVRVRASTQAVPGLALCGAGLDGVGIAACVASGRAAAHQALTSMRAL